MPKESIHILPIPAKKVRERRTIQVATDMMRGWDVAGPLFEAGCVKIALAQLPRYRGDLHRPDSHWFNLIVQGKMRYRLGGDTFRAAAGDLVCIPAGVPTKRTGLGPVVWIYIELEDIPAWAPLKKLGHSVRKYESADLMYILVRRIIEARLNQDVYSVKCAIENSQMLLTLLKRELHQSTNEWPSGRMVPLTGLLDQIREHPQDEWNRSTMAERINMSERNLSRVFQRTFNMPPARMVTTIRMDLATRLLRNTDRSLAAIANAVGYNSPFSFSRLFTKHLGVSPGKYRSLARTNRHSLPAR